VLAIVPTIAFAQEPAPSPLQDSPEHLIPRSGCAELLSHLRATLRPAASSSPGKAECNNIVDLLNVKVCADIWATGGYWHELQCSSRSTTNYYVINHRFERGCNSGRSYRTRAQWSYTDDDWGGGDLVWDYSNKNTC
jgi:hypothetical protein